ncbi:MAG: NB-ARC domain-containing protein, partial [Spirulinaceae cyanobacterium]
MIATVERDRIMGAEDNIETLIDLAERLLWVYQGRHLNHLEKEVLRGALQGKRYNELGDRPDNPLYHYETNYIARYIAYNLWKDLTVALRSAAVLSPSEKVSKLSVREHLQRALARECARPLAFSRVENIPESTVIHWAGRQSLMTRCQGLLQGDIRVLGLVGMVGVGKTALAARLAGDRVLQSVFPKKVWLQLDDRVSVFPALVKALLKEEAVERYSISYWIDALLEQLRSQKHLFVLDGLETVMYFDKTGHLHCRDRDLEQFLTQFLTTAQMPSRIIVTSQIDLRAIACGRDWQRVHICEVSGLPEEEALQLFRNWGIAESGNYLQRIARVYKGHPLALSAIASEVNQPTYQGSIAAYWSDYGSEIETAEQWSQLGNTTSLPRLERYSLRLADLVQNRLENSLNQLQQTFPLAVELLCLGAKQSQGGDRTAWLSWLCDRSPDEALIAFQALQRYGVLQKEQKGDRLWYRVHPLFLGVA